MSKIKCDNCGAENAKLYTRQNPKGVVGIFWCEVCTGQEHRVRTEADALAAAIEGVDHE